MIEIEKASEEKKSEKERNVLLFDCEESIDSFLIDELKEGGLGIFLTNDPNETLKMISREKINIILVDLKSNNKDLLELLKRLRKKHRGVNRTCLSEPDQRREVIQLLVKGIVSTYFEKPRGLDNLLDGLLHILNARETLKNEKLLELFDSGDLLPVFPKTYHEFIEAVENDRSIKEIGRIIEKDVAIATQVLRIANSEFQRGGHVGSIERAGIYLGLDAIKNIVLTVSLASMQQLTRFQKKQLDSIVQHSFKVNRSFANIYKQQTGHDLPDQYASVGITHDIGKVIMMQYLPKRFEKITKYVEKNPDVSFYRSEIELGFEGCTHTEIGAYFLNLWNFPEASVFTALNHHSVEPFTGTYRKLLDVFTLVNDISH